MKKLIFLLFIFGFTLKLGAQNNTTTNDLCSGYIIGSTITSIAYVTNKKYPELYGLGGTIAFSAGKQFYDVYHLKEKIDSRDIFGTMMGGLAGTITVGVVIDKKITPYYQLGVW
jgi:ammonia channel protein AmtB